MSAVVPQRFVPTGGASSSEDAPGWGGVLNDAIDNEEKGNNTIGPICWKCRDKKNHKKPCRVCHGVGRLPARKQPKDRLGRITKARKPFDSWEPSGPIPFGAALRCHKDGDHGDDYWANLVHRADQGIDVDLDGDSDDTQSHYFPIWAPRKGEELCRLVGRWRILQCVGCHRWTTDDLLTAWVAAQEISSICTRKDPRELNYLDLGTGNASVLQMVLWAAVKQNVTCVRALGVEARSEAVKLARRSLAFNIGPNNAHAKARIENGDFRDYPLETNSFHIITGTPPYFRVDFYMSNDNNDPKDNNKDKTDKSLVQAAIIQQGGMPTAKQSAPARCEFRGGVEAYCSVAARALVVSTGKLVVCENFKNHERALRAAAAAGLTIMKQVHVEGRPGRGILFVVYVMRHAVSNALEETIVDEMKLTVRGDDGQWTQEYLRTVMKDMSIPSFN